MEQQTDYSYGAQKSTVTGTPLLSCWHQQKETAARSCFWWPSLDAGVVAMCASCSICQEQARTPAKESLPPWVFPSKPFERVHMDFAEYNHRFYFLLVDAYSKCLEVFDVRRDSTTSRTVSCIGEVICRFGIQQKVVRDNGPQFTSSEV